MKLLASQDTDYEDLVITLVFVTGAAAKEGQRASAPAKFWRGMPRVSAKGRAQWELHITCNCRQKRQYRDFLWAPQNLS